MLEVTEPRIMGEGDQLLIFSMLMSSSEYATWGCYGTICTGEK